MLFARRAAQLDPSAENEELLSLVQGEGEGPELLVENPSAEPAGPPSLETAGRPRGFLARIFRRRS